MAQKQGAALAEHDIVVDLVGQALPELERQFHQVLQGTQAIVGAHDGGVASGVAAADPAALQNRDAAHAMVFGEIEGGRQAVPAAADDDDVIVRLGRRIAPGERPMFVARKSASDQAQGGISHAEARLGFLAKLGKT